MMHRGYPPTMRAFSVYVLESMAISGSVNINSLANPTTCAGSANPPSTFLPSSAPTIPTTTVNIRFADQPDRNVVDLCQDALNQMEQIVASAITQFGR